MSLFGRKTRPARRRTNQPAWITVDGGFAARQCTVIDISEGGARLRVEDPQFVKPQFQLKLDLQGCLEKRRRNRDQVRVA
jgi:hypothetical protein